MYVRVQIIFVDPRPVHATDTSFLHSSECRLSCHSLKKATVFGFVRLCPTIYIKLGFRIAITRAIHTLITMGTKQPFQKKYRLYPVNNRIRLYVLMNY